MIHVKTVEYVYPFVRCEWFNLCVTILCTVSPPATVVKVSVLGELGRRTLLTPIQCTRGPLNLVLRVLVQGIRRQ